MLEEGSSWSLKRFAGRSGSEPDFPAMYFGGAPQLNENLFRQRFVFCREVLFSEALGRVDAPRVCGQGKHGLCDSICVIDVASLWAMMLESKGTCFTEAASNVYSCTALFFFYVQRV